MSTPPMTVKQAARALRQAAMDLVNADEEMSARQTRIAEEQGHINELIDQRPAKEAAVEQAMLDMRAALDAS